MLGESADLSSAAKKLGLHGIIEGSVMLEGGRLRVTVKNSSPDGFQFCSHRFVTEANTESLGQIQEQIATAFISRARPEQSHIRRSKAFAGALTLAVYPHVIQAESLLDDGSALDIQAALLKFEDAARMAPAFARSFCGICMCQVELALRGARPSTVVVSRAKAAARRALELDPNMIESHSSLGCAQALEWDWTSAEASFQRAFELGVHAGASRQFAMVLTALGRFDEASHRLELAQRIDPFSSRQKTARAKFFYLHRQFERGAALISEPQIYGPLPIEAKFHSALMFTFLGKPECAVQIAESLRPDAGAQISMMAGLAEVLALAGATERAEQIVSDFKLFDHGVDLSRFRQAALALALGRKQESLSLLTKAAKDKEAELVWIAVDPRFDSIRSERDFAKIKNAVFADIPNRISCAVA